MSLPDPPLPPVGVLNVDDFFLWRGQIYGTKHVDLERHQVILTSCPTVRNTNFALWLRQHPEVRYIFCD